MNATTYAIDLAKNVFQLHWVEPGDGEIHRKKLQRSKVLEFFAQLQPCRIAMEACGGAHYWARQLRSLGHQVELLPPHKVKECASGNKDDARDARAIWVCATLTDVRRVGIKGEEQQAQLFTHRVRTHWMSQRTATVNLLRGMLYEYGLVAPKGRQVVVRWVAEHRASIEQSVPPVVLEMLDQQLQALRELDERILACERIQQQHQRCDPVIRELLKVPGIGPLGASALRAELGDGSGWKNSREFACCKGMAPAHTGTGGKVRVGAISKRGDAYVRTLLIHGARNLVRGANQPTWIAEMLKRRPFNVVAVAVAHKLARIAWAIVVRGERFDPLRAFGPTPQPAR